MTRRAFGWSLAGAAAAHARGWERPSFPDWSAGHIDRVLTDSPWAQSLTVPVTLPPPPQRITSGFAQIGFPPPVSFPGGRTGRTGPSWPGQGPSTGGSTGESTPVRTELYLIVRWASALPIRQAWALSRYGREGLQSKEAVQLLTEMPEGYIVEIPGFLTTSIRQGPKKLEQDLLKSARISLPGHRPLSANDSEVPEAGMHLMARLQFPRFADLSSNEGILTFTASSGPIQIEQKFKLAAMMYEGRLEL